MRLAPKVANQHRNITRLGLFFGEYSEDSQQACRSNKITTVLNLEENERMLIEEALKKSGMNQTRAAELLGISRDAMKRKIKKFGVEIVKEIGGGEG